MLPDPNLSSSLKILVVASTTLQMTPSRTACMEEWGRYEGARVSEQVASQTKHLPLAQETSVIPSGRMSLEDKLVGSRREGILARARARWMMSLIAE